jgi:hypothetical protein
MVITHGGLSKIAHAAPGSEGQASLSNAYHSTGLLISEIFLAACRPVRAY